MADAEMLEDIHDYDAAVQALKDGEELVPSEVVYALLEGANPIRVWREYRGLTQGALASATESALPICRNWKPANAPARPRYSERLLRYWMSTWMT
jgi:hypothetical protein